MNLNHSPCDQVQKSCFGSTGLFSVSCQLLCLSTTNTNLGLRFYNHSHDINQGFWSDISYCFKSRGDMIFAKIYITFDKAPLMLLSSVDSPNLEIVEAFYDFVIKQIYS